MGSGMWEDIDISERMNVRERAKKREREWMWER